MSQIFPGQVNMMILKEFEPGFAALVASWVRSDGELHWLAPSTKGPLTAEKVTGWQKSEGAGFVGLPQGSVRPVAYGELNPLGSATGQYWVGHVLVDPAARGRGVGREFVEELLIEAFGRRGARKVSLVVFPDNVHALHCYQELGFRLAGEEHHRFEAGGPLHRLLRFEIGGLPRSLLARVGSTRETGPRSTCLPSRR